ncbi:MAG: hypothetical protein KGJ62_05565 [Armatimonadetes bacterium]|nr:hypothetical protein [Armatimonadota bacterium]MDE2207557.1 hypothetical protein [Armatimonadota bacterium]
MNRTTRHMVYVGAFAAAMTFIILSVAGAQPNRGTAVVYPIVFSRNSGAHGSRVVAVRSVDEMMQRGGFTLVSRTRAAEAWRRLGMPRPTSAHPATLRELTRLGRAVGARYVVAPAFNFHSRSMWVDLGPRTVSTAIINIVIANASTGRFAYVRKGVTGRSDEKFNAVKAGADLLFTPLVTAVSGGPKTPHEERAVQIAVVRAMRGFVR